MVSYTLATARSQISEWILPSYYESYEGKGRLETPSRQFPTIYGGLWKLAGTKNHHPDRIVWPM